MCGRFTQKNKRETVKKEFGVEISKSKLFNQSYNISPTQMIGVVRVIEDKKEYANLKWGLIPSWSKDDSFAAKLINARAETLEEKPAFREAYRKRRCLIPASGFYEWQNTSGGKQPHYFYLKEKDIFGFGGLWEEWQDRDSGELVETCTIITTDANELVESVHDRMPVTISSNDYESWLNETPKSVSELLKPFDARKMNAHKVSKAVNSPVNDSEDLINEI